MAQQGRPAPLACCVPCALHAAVMQDPPRELLGRCLFPGWTAHLSSPTWQFTHLGAGHSWAGAGQVFCILGGTAHLSSPTWVPAIPGQVLGSFFVSFGGDCPPQFRSPGSSPTWVPAISGQVLDSPFSRLSDLMMELATDQQLRIPKPLIKVSQAGQGGVG